MIYSLKTKKMGIMVGLPTSGGTEKDLQLNFGLTVNDQVEMLAALLACRVVSAKWYTTNLAACRDRLGIYVG